MKVNGSLVFDASSASEIQNLRVQKYTGALVPVHTASDVGRAIYVTSAGTGVGAHGSYAANTLYVGGASSWVAIATGGNAAALQTELDNLEAAIGSGIINGADGTFTGAGFTTLNSTIWPTNPTSLENALDMLGDYVSGKDTLEEIEPVGAAGNIIYADSGSTWAQAAPGATSGVQAYDAFLTSIGTLGTAADKMIYTTGVDTAAETTLTGFARTVLDDADAVTARATLGLVIGTDVQAWDSDLDDIAALTPTDSTIIVGDGTNWVAESGATARASLGLTIGTDVQAYDADLAQLAGFTPADGEFIVGTGGAEGSRYALESGATVRTSLGLGDIATMDASSFIKTDGTSTVTADIAFGGFKLTGVAPATAGTDAVNKNQLDAAVTGLSWKQAVRVATTANITLSGTQTIDGVAVVAGDRVLVKDQSTAAENGIYIVAAGAWTRATDMDAAAEFDGAAVFVQEGTAQQGQGFTETATVTTVGTDTVTFSQFSGGQAFVGGVGIDITGNTISANLGAGIFELASDNIGIELYNATTGAIILTDDGSARATTNSSRLHLKTNTAQLDQDAGGLFIINGGVTEVQLAASVAGAGLGGGAGTALSVNVDNSTIEIATDTVQVKNAGITNAKLSTGGLINLKATGSTDEPMYLGEDLTFAASGVGGLAVAVATGNVVTYSTTNAAADGTTKGVATFTAADFSATSGVVSLVAKSIDAATDVDTTTVAPVAADVLSWDGTNWVPKKAYHVETVTVAGTSWTVTHSLGVKYCNVTVVDSSDEVVIPQSITFVDTAELTVTFNTAITGKVIVMGIA
jgi:hypothetical protein